MSTLHAIAVALVEVAQLGLCALLAAIGCVLLIGARGDTLHGFGAMALHAVGGLSLTASIVLVILWR